MYIPSSFKQVDLEEVRDFIDKNGFGILISLAGKRLSGTHIPLILAKDNQANEVLYGHVAKANPQGKAFQDGDEVLAIFNGPHAYVSSSWYRHENVPTWNYIAVHVYGTITLLEGDALKLSVAQLMEKYESTMEHPLRMDNLSEATLRQLQGIIGFKVRITEVQAAWKLSQNRNPHDYQQVIDHLRKTPDQDAQSVADEMEKIKK